MGRWETVNRSVSLQVESCLELKGWHLIFMCIFLQSSTGAWLNRRGSWLCQVLLVDVYLRLFDIHTVFSLNVPTSQNANLSPELVTKPK